MKKTLFLILTFINLFFALFHLGFWVFFNWNEELLKISVESRGILQILNITSCYLLLFASYTMYSYSKKIETTSQDKKLIMFFGGYYLIRAILGIPFFGFSYSEVFICVFCLVIFVIHLLTISLKFRVSSSE